ncbi:MAG: Ig-like domain repeat protein, partial [Candidatus Hadarchaeales archaeon]
ENFQENVLDSGWQTSWNFENSTHLGWLDPGYLPDAWYWWKVQAKDNAGNWMETGGFRMGIEASPPTIPVPLSPANGENINDNTPTLYWENSTDITLPISYYVWVARDPGFTNIAAQSGWVYENYWTVNVELPDNLYYWRLCARDNVSPPNVSENSVVYSFRVDTLAPPQVQLYRPDNRAGTENFSLSFEWYRVVDNTGVRYHIQVGYGLDFSNLVVNDNNVVDNTYSYLATQRGHYTWRVRAIDGAGNIGEWSENRVIAVAAWEMIESWTATISAPAWHRLAESWSAAITTSAWWRLIESWTSTINAPIPAPVLLSPPNNFNDNTAVFSFYWDNLQPADSYIVQIDNDLNNVPDFSTYIESPLLVGKSWTTTITKDGLYYWRVKMFRDNDGDSNTPPPSSEWSENWAFRRDTAAPAAPTIISPIPGENINDNTPLIDWLQVTTDANGAQENSLPLIYYAAVSDDPSFSYENRSSGWIENDNWTIAPALPDGVWYLRVRARDNAGNYGEWSARSFRVDTVPPAAPPSPPIYPQNNGWTKGSPNLDWTPVTDDSLPVMYEAWYSIYSDFPDAGTTKSGWIYDDNWQITGLSELYIYYWKVRAKDNAGNVGNFSSTWQFKVDLTPPSKVELSKPENNANLLDNLTVKLEWKHATDDVNNTGWYSGLENYIIQIDEDPGFGSPVQIIRPAAENSYIYTFPAYGRYYWRVRAVDAVGWEGAWADNFTLYIGRWIPAESWSATITTYATWLLAESWSATITTTAWYQLAE